MYSLWESKTGLVKISGGNKGSQYLAPKLGHNALLTLSWKSKELRTSAHLREYMF